MNEIGERIRSRRKELNITQTQIYKETGISSGNLSSCQEVVKLIFNRLQIRFK